MTVRSKFLIAAAVSALAMSTNTASAKEFFIAAGSTIPGFSSNGLCEADGYGSGGCERFGSAGTCGGFSIYVGDHAYKQMVNEYRQGEKITIRHLNANGSFGDVICTFKK